MSREESEDDPLADETLPQSGARPSMPPAPLRVGDVLAGRYCLTALLGRGGSGSVFRATDSAIGETVAIKVLHPDRARDRSWIKRLAREVKLARAIRHPNVCRVFDLGNADGHPFITMELASGTLRGRLREETRPWTARLEEARAVCAGLSAIHAIGFTHRDVTPQNVLTMPDGRLVISDFGLALADQETTTMYGGTPNYLPPEVMQGQRSDQRSDVWQLGVVLHEIVFGRRPEWRPKGERSELAPPPITNDETSAVAEELFRVCSECLAPDPSQRPPNALIVTGRLAAAEAAKKRGRTMRQLLRARRWVSRQRRPLAAALVALLVLGGVARGVQVASRPALCRGGTQRASVAWNEELRGKIAAAFAASGKPYAADALAGVTRILGSYTQRWSSMYTETCEATHVRGDQSPEVMDLRMVCLNERLEDAKSLTTTLAKADAKAVARAVDAASGLRSIDDCADVAALRAGVQPPRDPALRAKVTVLRRELADARTMSDVGNWPAAAQRAEAIATRADELQYHPLVGQSLEALGFIFADMDRNRDAWKAFEKAVLVAQANGDDETAAAACAGVVYALAHLSKFEAAEIWDSLCESLLIRSGDRGRLRGWLLNSRGVMLTFRGDHQQAVETFQTAVELKGAVLGRADPDVARSLMNMALALMELGRYEDALSAVDRSTQLFAPVYGNAHPLVARNIINKGLILLRAANIARARENLLRAQYLLDHSEPDDSSSRVEILYGLGMCDVADGNFAVGTELLEHAFKVRPPDQLGQPLSGDLPFALAQALWRQGGQRERATRIAAQARDEYRQFGREQKATEVESWLAHQKLPKDARARPDK